ncbi:MAG: hypothetical protein RR732_03705, partial [Bacilli bacterium]
LSQISWSGHLHRFIYTLVVSDTEDKVTLIMDKNLISFVAWSDFNIVSNGPDTALKTLEIATKEWTNVSSFNYELLILNVDNTTSSIAMKTNVKARLLTKNEALNLSCVGGRNFCPSWLVTNLSIDNTEKLPFGFWLSTAVRQNVAWYINYSKDLNGSTVYYLGQLGVRSVIELYKI